MEPLQFRKQISNHCLRKISHWLQRKQIIDWYVHISTCACMYWIVTTVHMIESNAYTEGRVYGVE